MKGTLSCAQPLHFLLCVLLTPHISQTMHACMCVCERICMHSEIFDLLACMVCARRCGLKKNMQCNAWREVHAC